MLKSMQTANQLCPLLPSVPWWYLMVKSNIVTHPNFKYNIVWMYLLNTVQCTLEKILHKCTSQSNKYWLLLCVLAYSSTVFTFTHKCCLPNKVIFFAKSLDWNTEVHSGCLPNIPIITGIRIFGQTSNNKAAFPLFTISKKITNTYKMCFTKKFNTAVSFYCES